MIIYFILGLIFLLLGIIFFITAIIMLSDSDNEVVQEVKQHLIDEIFGGCNITAKFMWAYAIQMYVSLGSILSLLGIALMKLV